MVRNEAPIAQIYFKKKIAQRRYSDSVIWEHLQDQSKLYNEDIIRTENGAVAIINFDNEGPTVQIEENTMIQIFASKDGELNLSLTGGNVSIDTTQAKGRVQVKLGNGSVVNLEKGSRMSASNEAGKDSIVIQEGTGSVVSENGDEEIIPAGSTIKIDENGKRSNVPVSVDNLTTPYKVLKFADEEKKVEFNIKSDSKINGNKIIVETSKSPDFTNIIEKQIVKIDDKIQVSADSGNVYYRVYTEDNKEEAFVGKVVVETVSRPVLISPKSNVVFESVNLMPEILFSWDSGSYCDYSIIEIFDENDVKNPVLRKKVFGTSYKVSNLNEGNFFWHIIPHYIVNTDFDVKPTDDFKFTIIKQNENISPMLSVPTVESEIILSEEDKSILFAWKSDIKESEYNLQISKDLNFENVIIESQTNSLKQNLDLNINKLSAGKYYWRVSRIDENNKKFFSSVRDFTVKEYVPLQTQLVYPPENFTIESSRCSMTHFAWKLSDLFDAENCISVFEVSENQKFDSVVQNVKTSELSLRGINLNPGKYFWRIKVLEKKSNNEIFTTLPRALVVVKELQIPFILEPINNKITHLFSNNSIKVIWKKVDGADYYKVKLFDALTDVVLSQSDSVYDNSYAFTLSNNVLNNLENIKFKVSVQAYTIEKENAPVRISKANNVLFSIEPIKKTVPSKPINKPKTVKPSLLKEPVLISPAENFVIDISYLRDFRNIQFKWSENKLVNEYLFELYQKNDKGTSRRILSAKITENSYLLSDLTVLDVGEFEWRVTAFKKAADGSINNKSKTVSGSFSVNLNLPDTVKVKDTGRMYGE